MILNDVSVELVKVTKCLVCNKIVTEASRSTRKFCSDNCRKRNFNRVSVDKRRESNIRYRNKKKSCI